MSDKLRSRGLVAWGGSIALHGLALAGLLWWLNAVLEPAKPKSEPVPLSLAMLVEPLPVVQPAESVVEAVTEPAPPEPVAEPEPIPEPIPEPAPLPVVQPPPPKPKPEKPKPVKPKVEKPKVEKPRIKPQETPIPAAPSENVAPSPPLVAPSAPAVPALPPPAPAVLDSKADDAYMAQVRQAVDQHKIYPRMSRRMEEEGRVIVEFSLAPNGALLDVHIKKTSGSDRLDEAALQAVRDAAPFAPFPEGSTRRRWEFSLPLSFSLN